MQLLVRDLLVFQILKLNGRNGLTFHIFNHKWWASTKCINISVLLVKLDELEGIITLTFPLLLSLEMILTLFSEFDFFPFCWIFSFATYS